MSGINVAQSESPHGDAVCIALLEDDPVIADLLALTFGQAGWDHRHYATIAAIGEALMERRFDLLMLDWSLPDGEAGSVIRLVRDRFGWDLPIVIESVNDDEQQIVNALELGADDYVVKPLRMSEVQARVAALLRRSRRDVPVRYALGAYRIDEANHEVYLNEAPLQLTVKEYELTRYFFRHPNELLSRERLLAEVWERNPEIDTRTVDAHVGRVRKKLGLGAEMEWQISTLRGYGYRLENVS